MTPSPPMTDLARHADRAARGVRRVDHDKSGCWRSGGRWTITPSARVTCMQRRPHRGLGRAVHVPQRAHAARAVRAARSRGSASPPHSALKPAGAAPAGLEQQCARSPASPASSSTLCSSIRRAEALAVECLVARGEHDARAHRQRQHRSRDRDVERQRGRRRADGRRPEAGLALHRCEEIDDARCGTRTPLGLPVEPDV